MPWESIQVDLFGPWHFTFLLGIEEKICAVSIIDIATYCPELHAYNDKRSETISQIVDR